jgi:hypothetical protein
VVIFGFLLLMVISSGCGDLAPDAIIEEDTAYISVKMNSLDDQESAGWKIASDVYETAKKHDVSRIVVRIYRDESQMSDRYGNPGTDNRFIGEFEKKDLEE